MTNRLPPAHRRYQRPAAFLAAVLACLVAACRSAPQAPAAPAVGTDTWAVVNGREIKRDEVEKSFRRSGGNQQLSEEEALSAKLTVLEDLIVQDILLARARELKIEVPEKELDDAYAQARANLTDEAFQQELQKRSLNATDMRDSLRRELLAQKLIEREVGAKVTVTDQEVADFFNANRAQFNLEEDAYRLAQIVVTPVREAQVANRTGNDAATQQEANTKVAMLMERLKSGVEFSALAMDYSEDPESAARGGDVGLVPLSRLKQSPPPLRDAVLQSKPGSARVVTQGGAYTIVVVVAHEPAGQRDLATPGVRDRITEGLRGRKEQLLRSAYLTAVRTDADVVNYLARRIVESDGKLPRP